MAQTIDQPPRPRQGEMPQAGDMWLYRVILGETVVLCGTAADALNLIEALHLQNQAENMSLDTYCNTASSPVSSTHGQEHLAHPCGPEGGSPE